MNEEVVNSVKLAIEKSKSRVDTLFFKIIRKDDEYKIIQYIGPSKSNKTMISEGWNRHEYLKNFINESYPILDINDFKSDDGICIIKKSEDDEMKDELKEIIEYYNMNRRLYAEFISFKKILDTLSIDFLKFQTFESLHDYVKSSIEKMSIPQTERANLMMKLAESEMSIIRELEKMNIDSPLDLLSKKFKHFLVVV